MDRLTVPEAARLLGITQAAIYKRISRGTIEHEKDGDGHVHVYLDTSDIPTDNTEKSTDAYSDKSGVVNSTDLIAELRAHNESLRQEVEAWREESRRKDHIIAGLVNRIPELPAAEEQAREAPSEPRESPVTDSEEPGRSTVPPEQEKPTGERRSWWRRLLR